MKKICMFTILLIPFLSFLKSYSQPVPVYPIPSYNVEVQGYANFVENYGNSNHPNQVLEKRDVSVLIKSGTHRCEGTAWVYTLDHLTVLGPYSLICDETLVVEIDDQSWGVLVFSENDVLVDVWISQP